MSLELTSKPFFQEKMIMWKELKRTIWVWYEFNYVKEWLEILAVLLVPTLIVNSLLVIWLYYFF
jgi:hypothetical protein